MGPIRTGHFWRFHPGQSVDISNLSPQQKDEGTEKQRRGLDFGQKSSQAAKTFMITEPQPNPSPQRTQGAQRTQGKAQTGGGVYPSQNRRKLRRLTDQQAARRDLMDVKLSRFNPPVNLARTDPEQLRDLLRADCLDLRGALSAPQANCLPAGNAHPSMGLDRDFRPPLRKGLRMVPAAYFIQVTIFFPAGSPFALVILVRA